MEIDKFIDFLEEYKLGMISRGTVIDKLADNNDNWILVLKAILIKRLTFHISTNYLLEKLNFMKKHPNQAHLFLDIQGLNIYNCLRGYYG